MTDIFSSQALTVKHDLVNDENETRVKITNLSGGPRDAEVYLTIDFNYGYIPNNYTKPEDLYELMQELQVKYILN